MAFLKVDPAKLVPVGPEVIQSLDAMATNNRLLWLQLCGQSPLPTGYFDTPVTGAAVQAAVAGLTANYIELFKNRGTSPVGIAIYSTWAGPGKQVKISQNANLADESVIDYLGSTAAPPAFNKRISSSIVVFPNQSIYVASNDVGVVLVAADLLRILVFDPNRYMDDTTWEARR